jgi:hypothetical protein
VFITFRQLPNAHTMPLAVATDPLALVLHPQRVNEPVPDGLGEYGIA